jgi:hypothetical protein
MTRAPSLKLRAYLALAGVGSIAGLSLGHPWLVALVAPLAGFVAVGLAVAHTPRFRAEASVGETRVLERVSRLTQAMPRGTAGRY